MPTTELVILSLKDDAKIGDPDNYASSIVKGIGQTLLKNKALQMHFGTMIEDSSKLRLVIDWPSLDVHKEFMASEGYKTFSGNIKPMLTAPPQIVHVDFKADGALDKVLAAPVTEFANIYFDGDVPASYADGIAKLEAIADQVPEAVDTVAWGSSYETVEYEGVKGKAAVVALGWSSYEAHMEFRKTPMMAEIAPHLLNVAKARSMNHIKALKFVE